MTAMISSLHTSQCIGVTHASDVAAARRYGQRMAQQLGFDDVRTGQLAIVITEAATNMLKHASGGRIFLSETRDAGHRGVQIVAIDSGPGIVNIAQSMRDGTSTTGTSGTGLGAMRRLANAFDIFAPAGGGAVCFMQVYAAWQTPPAAMPDFGAVCLPLAGEEESGDAWAISRSAACIALLMADGLGHGPDAAVAANAAVDTFALQPTLAPALQLEACHHALRSTRGVALAVALVDCDRDEICFAGVGNISASVTDAHGRRQMMSHNGIVGHNMRKAQQLRYPCADGALVIMHSDGIATQWELASYPGLIDCVPAIIAAVLLRDHARVRDDAAVLVLRVVKPARRPVH